MLWTAPPPASPLPLMALNARPSLRPGFRSTLNFGNLTACPSKGIYSAKSPCGVHGHMSERGHKLPNGRASWHGDCWGTAEVSGSKLDRITNSVSDWPESPENHPFWAHSHRVDGRLHGWPVLKATRDAARSPIITVITVWTGQARIRPSSDSQAPAHILRPWPAVGKPRCSRSPAARYCFF